MAPAHLQLSSIGHELVCLIHGLEKNNINVGQGMGLSWKIGYPECTKSWVPSIIPCKLHMMLLHACNSSSWEVKAGESDVQGHSLIHRGVENPL